LVLLRVDTYASLANTGGAVKRAITAHFRTAVRVDATQLQHLLRL
jgi:hypothetical protein